MDSLDTLDKDTLDKFKNLAPASGSSNADTSCYLPNNGTTGSTGYATWYDNIPAHSCPNCGYCPCCGRPSYTRPSYVPYMPTYYGNDYTYTHTNGCTSGNIQTFQPLSTT